MIVELIGCTGAGKTTLAHRLASMEVVPGRRVLAMPELALPALVLRRLSSQTAVNVAQEARCLPSLIRSVRRREEFLFFSRRRLVRSAPTILHRANRLRGVARRVGMFELARARAPADVVLADEGTILLAYMFALDGCAVSDADLEQFAALVPLPDVVVNLLVPVDVLVQRARVRTDRARQLGRKSRRELEHLISATDELFQRLVTFPPLRSRVITVGMTDDVHDVAARLRVALSHPAEESTLSASTLAAQRA